MMERSLGARISAMLAERGVDTIFGIPGVHNIELYRGLEESGLRHVLARHEQGAGFMADGYARATGRPGIAYVITGPGLTNIMTPMGQAYSDSVPLLVISSCLNRADLGIGRGRLHEMKDQQGAGETVCDWSRTAMDAESAYSLVDRALVEFEVRRPRPKHVQIPIEILEAPAAPPPTFTFPGPAELGSARVSQAALERILAARRPLFIFGGGTRHVPDLARQAVEGLRAACFMTYGGRGVIPPGHSLSFGSFLARPDSVEIIASADVVIAVGTELSETDLWRERLGHTGELIHVDLDPVELSEPGAWNILCEAGAFLERLLDALEGHRASTEWAETEMLLARARWYAAIEAERPGILPVAEILRDALPADCMIYSDMTQFAYVSKEVWDMSAPGLWHHPFGFGTLGFALPAAIGGKVGMPDRPVVAIAGDYGFQYTMQELGTAAELGMGLPILVWDNEMLKEIEASMARSQIAPVGVSARNPDFGKLAAAYGIGYSRPADPSDLQTDLRDAFGADGPTLIHMTPSLSG